MSRVLKDVGFVHLHVHSSYSLLEGALRIADLAKLAAADRQPALALTDTNNLFGALEFSEKLAGLGLQPIAGMQLSVVFEAADPNARSAQARGVERGPPRPDGGGLRQPDAPREPGLFRRAPRRRAPRSGLCPRRERGRSRLPDRRADGPARRGPALRPGGPCRGAAGDPEARLRRPALRRDPAARAGGRTPGRGRPDRPRRPPRPASRRDERALLRRRSGFRGPRRAARHRRRPRRLRREPATALARARLQDPGGDGDPVRRSAGGPRRAPSRSRCAAPFGCASASRSCRASAPARRPRPWTRTRSCAGRRRRGWRPACASTGRPRASRKRRTGSASPTRSPSSRA